MKRCLFSLCLVAVLAGCQTVGDFYDRIFGGNRPTQKPSELVQFTPSVQPRILWQGSVGPAERDVFFPAVSGNAVFVAGTAGQVAGYEANTGRTIVRFSTGQRLSAGVAATGSIELVATTKAEVLAYDRAGRLLWSAQLAGEVLAPPAIEGDTVVARTGDGRIYGFAASDGKRRWIYQRSTPALSVRTPTGVLAERGAVFAGFPGGRLVALTIENGAVGWESIVALPRGTTELERVADVIGLPVADGQRVCAVAYQGRVVCFDAQSGSTQWARDISSVAGMAADDRHLYITDDHSAVVALDKASGASLWKQDKMSGRILSAPLALGRFVIVGDYQGYVHLLSRDDGSFAGRIATDGSPIEAPPVALDFGTFLVQTRKGGVYAIAVK